MPVHEKFDREPFDREKLVASLPLMADISVAPVSAAFADYVRFYGLDFAGRISGLIHRAARLEVGGYQIVVQHFGLPQPRGTALVVHGYFDHVGIFDHVIEQLLMQGMNVVAFDLPGHGLSSGVPAAINSFDEYQAVLRAVLDSMTQASLPQPWHVVAQSTGGAIIMDYLLDNRRLSRTPFAQVILLAPLVRPVNWTFNRALYHLISPFTDSIKRKFVVNSHDEEFLRFLREGDPLQSRRLSVRWVGALKKWIPVIEARAPLAGSDTARVTVIQGDDDGTVDWRHNLVVIREKFPGTHINMIAGGKHQLANEAPEFRAQVFAVLDRVLH